VTCAACHRTAFEMLAVDAVEGIEICDACVEKLARIRPGDPISCDACSGSFYGDARCAWICRESGGAAFCDICSSVVSKGTSA